MLPIAPRILAYLALMLIIGDACFILKRSNRPTVAERACVGLQTFSVSCNEPVQRF